MKYCKTCLQPDTRPGIVFNDKGICPGCLHFNTLQSSDWNNHKNELDDIVSFGKSNSSNGYDSIIGVSGGKDSLRQAIFVKEVLGMNPLLVCMSHPPEQVSQIGVNNLSNLISKGFDCISIQPAPGIWKKLMHKSFFSSTNWQRSTELALFSSVPKMAVAYQIPLIWWGENPSLQLGDQSTMGRNGWDGNNLRKGNTIKNADYKWLLEKDI